MLNEVLEDVAFAYCLEPHELYESRRAVIPARNEAWRRLAIRGWTLTRIARAWGMDDSAVSRTLKGKVAVSSGRKEKPVPDETVREWRERHRNGETLTAIAEEAGYLAKFVRDRILKVVDDWPDDTVGKEVAWAGYPAEVVKDCGAMVFIKSCGDVYHVQRSEVIGL